MRKLEEKTRKKPGHPNKKGKKIRTPMEPREKTRKRGKPERKLGHP